MSFGKGFDKYLTTHVTHSTSVLALSQEQSNQDAEEVGLSHFQEAGQGGSGQ